MGTPKRPKRLTKINNPYTPPEPARTKGPKPKVDRTKGQRPKVDLVFNTRVVPTTPRTPRNAGDANTVQLIAEATHAHPHAGPCLPRRQVAVCCSRSVARSRTGRIPRRNVAVAALLMAMAVTALLRCARAAALPAFLLGAHVTCDGTGEFIDRSRGRIGRRGQPFVGRELLPEMASGSCTGKAHSGPYPVSAGHHDRSGPQQFTSEHCKTYPQRREETHCSPTVSCSTCGR